jgi:hypothetical protein
VSSPEPGSVSYTEPSTEVALEPALEQALREVDAVCPRQRPGRRTVVHLHDYAASRPRTPETLECVVVSSEEPREIAETVVVRLSLGGEVRGVRTFSGTVRRQGEGIALESLLDPLLLEALPRESWRSRTVDFVTVYETPPPANPSRSSATALVDARTHALVWAATAGRDSRYVGP